jgi:protein-tyrosine phosphatase
MNRSRESGSTNRAAGISISPRVGSCKKEAFRVVSAAISSLGSNSQTFRETLAGRKVRVRRSKMGIDITWVTERIGVGGGIWTAENMAAVSRAGITHIIDMQIEFDDTRLAEGHGITVCWNPVDDDFEPKPAEVFARGVDFALAALQEDGTKLLVHCAAGVHRAPMMTLALLAAMGWRLKDAMELIEGRRPVADFAEVYVRSVEEFLRGRA